MTARPGGSSRPPVLAAAVAGFPAYVISVLLEEALPQKLVALQRASEQGRLHADHLANLGASWAAIREAGTQWSQWRASVDGSTEELLTEMPADSAEIDTHRAADLLAVTPSRVRQLVRNGHLSARMVGRTWLVDRASVELRRETRNESVR